MLGTAIFICTDVSSAAVIAHVAHCARVLPQNDWPRDIVAQMCKDTEVGLLTPRHTFLGWVYNVVNYYYIVLFVYVVEYG